MRSHLIITAVVLLCCIPASAADRDNVWRISILAAEISSGTSAPYSDDPHAGVSLGLAYAPTPQWDVELTAASQSHVSPYTRVFYMPAPGGNAPGSIYPVTEFRRYRVMPVDLSVTRHFLSDQAIAPYVRAGVRYVDAPDDPVMPSVFFSGENMPVTPVEVAQGFHFDSRLSGQAGAGVRVRLTPRTALRGEATRLLRSDRADFDPLTRYAIGVSWLF